MFLRQLKVDEVGEAFKTGNWRKLYRRFLDSPHFRPWFELKRSKCVADLNGVLKMMRLSADHASLTHGVGGAKLCADALDELKCKIHAAIQEERKKIDFDGNYVDVMQTHFEVVREAARH